MGNGISQPILGNSFEMLYMTIAYLKLYTSPSNGCFISGCWLIIIVRLTRRVAHGNRDQSMHVWGERVCDCLFVH